MFLTDLRRKKCMQGYSFKNIIDHLSASVALSEWPFLFTSVIHVAGEV